tara:strand:- start:1986 stop:3794 length:1809 start_codon:yes stop_codon:yes gene_type:complete
LPFEKKDIVPVNYTSRDFESIKKDLITHVKRYYPNVYQDFNEASFGSIMLDTVSYVGDVLSFYMDYNVNESFLESAIETNNVIKLARQMGYRYKGYPVASGILTLYIVVPASSNGIQPDLDYAPILKAGTIFGTKVGNITYTLNEDVDFSLPSNEVVVATVDSATGVPTGYAIKAKGQIISGEVKRKQMKIGPYQRFRKVLIPDTNISEIISVRDLNGNEYFEVDYLTQDTIYVPVVNKDSDSDSVPSILKPKKIPRRFVFEQLSNQFYLQFGYGSEKNLTNEIISDPSKVIMQVNGKDYIVDESFDPTNLVETDKMGIAPANTSLTVEYRTNSTNRTNAGSRQINNVTDPKFSFANVGSLSQNKVRSVITSLEFENEKPIIGSVSTPTLEEIKYRAYGAFSSQNRAVTATDYKSLIYNMPPKFGAVKRCNIVQDDDSFKRNLNLYVISENSSGHFARSTENLKRNLKNHLSSYKMINDTIDILDAKIVNISIKIDIIAEEEKNKFEVLQTAIDKIKFEILNHKYDIGEPVRVSDIFKTLKNCDGVLDVVSVDINRKRGSLYSTFSYDVKGNTSPDGRLILGREDVVFEVKYPNSDIVGTVR